MKGIYLLLGSNMGDREQMLQSAIEYIDDEIGEIVQSSCIYQTKAWGIEDQPDFFNQVVEIDTELSPIELLKKVNEIEEKLGRVRYMKWHSRIIDIDILYYGDWIITSDSLNIPHPENANRNFVLVPMVEIAPDFVHPKLLVTQRTMLQKSTDNLDVTLHQPIR